MNLYYLIMGLLLTLINSFKGNDENKPVDLHRKEPNWFKRNYETINIILMTILVILLLFLFIAFCFLIGGTESGKWYNGGLA